MPGRLKVQSAAFKAKVALAAVNGVQLQETRAMKHFALTFVCIAVVPIASAGAQAGVIYKEGFESGTAPGWSFSGALNSEPPDPLVTTLWHVTQNDPASGAFALGYVKDETPGSALDGNYNTGSGISVGHNSGDAVSPAILLPNGPIALYFDVAVSVLDDSHDFDRLLLNGTFGIGIYDQIVVQGHSLASTSPVDGGLVSIPVNSGYHRIGLDLSAFAGGPFRLHFAFDTFDGIANDGQGIRIDNIEIDTGPVVPEPSSFILFSFLFGALAWQVCAKGWRVLATASALGGFTSGQYRQPR